MLYIPYPDLIEKLESLFSNNGFEGNVASELAMLFAKASLEGVPSHGLDRVAVFLGMVQKGKVLPGGKPSLMGSFGSFERWSGNFGPGPLNAQFSMDRAISLAKDLGIGLVSLQSTNHWMRAGNYGWQAVDSGCIGICFTNTKPNMPAWGGKEPKLGNNPLVVAIPRKKGHVVLDLAMSQFSYGKLKTYLREGKDMPFAAGFDSQGNLSNKPAEIIDNDLALPIGLWKGAGLSMVLDMLAAVLSGGHAVHQVGQSGDEFGLSQVFLCIDPVKLGLSDQIDSIMDAIIEDLHGSATFDGKVVRYPGENIASIREKNHQYGVPVDEGVWAGILGML